MPSPIAYSVREAAQALGLSIDTTYRYIADGTIPARRVGGRLLIPVRKLEQWIDDTDAPSPTGDADLGLDDDDPGPSENLDPKRHTR
jgi:excisionase family DNA binding protein